MNILRHSKRPAKRAELILLVESVVILLHKIRTCNTAREIYSMCDKGHLNLPSLVGNDTVSTLSNVLKHIFGISVLQFLVTYWPTHALIPIYLG